MKYNALTQKIQELLKQNGFWYEAFEHEPVRTSEEAAKIRPNYTIEQGAKAIILRIKVSAEEKYFIMLVVPGDKRFDEKKVKDLLNAKDIRFATEEEVMNITDGVIPGGIPPLGNLFNLRTLVDPLIFENEKIIFNAGDKKFSIGMKSEDYKKLAKPEIVNII